MFEVGFSQPVDLEEVRASLAAGGIEDFQVRTYGTASELEVRLPPAATGAADADARRVIGALKSIDPAVKLNRTESVGPQVSQQLGQQAALALLMTLLLVLIYIAFRFRWRFGVGSLVASLHDPIVAVGAIALLGIPFDLNVVAALLRQPGGAASTRRRAGDLPFGLAGSGRCERLAADVSGPVAVRGVVRADGR